MDRLSAQNPAGRIYKFFRNSSVVIYHRITVFDSNAGCSSVCGRDISGQFLYSFMDKLTDIRIHAPYRSFYQNLITYDVVPA